MRRAFSRPGVLVAILIMFVLLECMGLVWIFDLFLHVTFGWIFFLGRSFQQTSFSPGAFATAVVCGLGFIFGLHFFIRHKAGRFASFCWNWKQSLIVSTATVLMFVAGISIVGVTHQISWLATSPEPIVESTFDAVYRTYSKNNLRQFGIASYNYHDAFEVFPVGGSFDSDGQGLHSWETFLLPYVDQAKLYEEIDFTKPWADEVHRDVFQKRIGMFRNQGYDIHLGRTPDNASHYAMNTQVAGANRSINHSAFSDGTTNTLFTGEVRHAPRAWGDPLNFRDPAIGFESPTGFGSVWLGGYVQFALADGSVRVLSADTDPAVLKALSTPSGGEVTDDF